ncbi:DUF6572 domain-containing protein [Cupriavidus sp. H39]|uniref:DUF6572 domain-containing protein n=1 Tax=Cupriavidus sp. H39 TaxID=3401635 RepID=UPI003D01EC51
MNVPITVQSGSTIDAIGVDRQTGAVHLNIVDSLPWDTAHLQLLQAKINTYLGFIESGEVYSCYPEAKGDKWLSTSSCDFAQAKRQSDFLRKRERSSKATGLPCFFATQAAVLPTIQRRTAHETHPPPDDRRRL